MIILGIDPALSITGYGAIQAVNAHLVLIEAGIIKTSAKDILPKRLDKIYSAIIKLISETKPDVLVLEKLFAHYRHPVTAFLLGQARGVICLACAAKNIPLVEYAATRVKKAIVGKGHASKMQVQRMIVNTLNLEIIPKYTDVTDALALAVAHSSIARVRI
ncbi:MAG: crossover junction endodeoxyribonuclease RuvC [Candidatus Omnitrophota bacterium]